MICTPCSVSIHKAWLAVLFLAVTSYSAGIAEPGRAWASDSSPEVAWHEVIRCSRTPLFNDIARQGLEAAEQLQRWNAFWQSLRKEFPELQVDHYSQAVRGATAYVEPVDALELWVATGGDDRNDGSRDRPFASIARARNAIRSLKQQHGRLKRPVRVVVRGGTYYLPETIVLGPEDSGTAACPIVYEAAEGERVVLSGGRPITESWRTDDGKVFYTELPESKVPHWPGLPPATIEMHFRDQRGVHVTGPWRTGSWDGQAPYLVINHQREDNAEDVEPIVRFGPDIAKPGHYRVLIDGSPCTNRSTRTIIEVAHAGGKSTVRVDQRRKNDWHDLGIYRFEAGRKGSVTVRTRQSDGYVVARRLRLVPEEPGKAGPWHFRQLMVNGRRQRLARYPNFDPSNVTENGWLHVAKPEPQQILFGLDKRGDFLACRFHVPADGRYVVWLGYCTVFDAAHKNLSLKIDGKPVELQPMPASGGWRDVKYVPLATTTLTEGDHTLRLDNTAGSKGASRPWMRIHLDAFILTDNPGFRMTDGRPGPAIPAKEHRIWIQAEDERVRVAGASSNGFATAPIPAPDSVDQILVDRHSGGRSIVRPAWREASQAEVFVFATWGWYNEIARLVGIKPTALPLSKDGRQLVFDELQLEGKQLRTRLRPQNRFFVFNVREELDELGEWFLDYRTGRLSYMPPGDSMKGLDVVAPRLMRIFDLSAPTESEDRIEHVVLRGFHLQDTDYSTDRYPVRSTTDCAIRLNNCWHCAVENCTLTNVGGYGIRLHMDSCLNRIVGNTITRSGGGGVILTAARVGWPGQNPAIDASPAAERYAPLGNLIAENHVHHCGQYLRYNAGIHTESRPAHMAHAPGNVYAQNHIHHLPRNGIFCFAQQAGHVIEHNHLHDLLLESDDGGAIHICAAHHPDAAATLIRNNLIRDIIGYRYHHAEHTNAHGVYLDGATSNVRVTHNVIQNTRKGCMFYHLGKNNVVENNIFADDRRAQTWLTRHWEGNCFRRNIVVWSTPESAYFLVLGMKRKWSEGEPSQFDRNLIWHDGQPVSIEAAGNSSEIRAEFPDNQFNLTAWQAKGFERNSLVADPLFVDRTRPELGLKPESPAWKLGFEPIRFMKPIR